MAPPALNRSCQVIYSQFDLAIHQNDHQARCRFVEWAQNEIAVVPDFHKRILVSYEAHFWLNGYVNKQNCRIWSEANPQVYVETPFRPEKLTVWCALWAGGIIGPHFFKNDESHNLTVNGDRYRAMITNIFIPELNNHDVQELWFQQDGATCHTARATIDLLKDTLGDRLISRFGPVNWPPRSCDLTPLDYFLWVFAKSLDYADKPQTLDHLEDNIRRVIADIRPQMLEKVIENWTSRLDYIRASRGSHMPEIIVKILLLPSHPINSRSARGTKNSSKKSGTGLRMSFGPELIAYVDDSTILLRFEEEHQYLTSLVASGVTRILWPLQNQVLGSKPAITEGTATGNEVTSTTDQHNEFTETSSRTRGYETTPLRVKGDVEDVSSELVNGGFRLHFLDETPRILLFSETVRSAGCKCLPFLLVKSAREVPAFRFFPEKDKEEVSSVFTCNIKQTKEVLLEVAIDLGVEVNSTLTKSEIKNRICQSEDYNEESVKSLLEGILAEKREARELKERQEARELKERQEARELKERQEARELKKRQEARELKERQEARELKERQETRAYELERLRLSNATETVSVSSADLEGQGVNRRVNLKDLVPKFDAKMQTLIYFLKYLKGRR
ncbi:uncharacterized protein TNCV_4157261 [Trichonephila clavipes]|nr:uncharacterized protein TNCV_4157261 [Trichonephila clavipes]